jgi:hypothetical protein
LQAAASEVLVVVAYGEILPPEVLSLPAVAPVNVHFSLLPALRGADPVRRAILAGHERTGVTTLRMDEGLDTGPILLQAGEPILPDDDAHGTPWIEALTLLELVRGWKEEVGGPEVVENFLQVVRDRRAHAASLGLPHFCHTSSNLVSPLSGPRQLGALPPNSDRRGTHRES